MTDDTTKRGPEDRNRINLKEDYEIRYWTQEFGVSKEKLEELVRQHGNSVAKIRENIKRNVA